MALWGKTDTLASAPKYISPSVSFDSANASIVSANADTIIVTSHGLATGQVVRYSVAGGDANNVIGGLTAESEYYTIRVDQDTLSLAANATAAAAGTDIDLTAVGVGTHTLKVVPSAFFIDKTEATIESNRDAGLKTAGWNTFTTYTAASGETRRKVEPLVAMRVAASDAGDAGVSGNTSIEDATVADS
jgi:hypothetical protein